jgi:predicted site-specific integrase-resolvase
VRKCVYPVLDYQRLLTPAQMAAAWGVNGKTLYMWAQAGKIRSIVTPGGISRYPASELPPAFALETGEPPP